MRSTLGAALTLTLGVGLFLSLATTCFGQSSTTSDEDAIRKADAEWSQSAKLGSLDTFLTFYADDASVLPFNAPMVVGKNNIQRYFSALFSKPGWNVSFGPTKIEVSRSRDIAYEIGTAQITFNDAQGHPVTTPAKYVVTWKRDAHQQWKAVADIFNTDK
jgi:uncharacterized protein (TIGR02246 family)